MNFTGYIPPTAFETLCAKYDLDPAQVATARKFGHDPLTEAEAQHIAERYESTRAMVADADFIFETVCDEFDADGLPYNHWSDDPKYWAGGA